MSNLNTSLHNKICESPDYLQTSLAAAMTLGFKNGKFYRNAKLFCVNLLLTYKIGCQASCAFCGLSKNRLITGNAQDKSFIRVEWPIYKLDDIINALNSDKCNHVERVCLSMVTNNRAPDDLLTVNNRIFNETHKLLSALISPTIISSDWLLELRKSGTDHVGIAFDAASPELFDQLRGSGVNGPHKWDRYWTTLIDCIKIFQKGHVGVHLIVGLGESEKLMALTFQQIHDSGALIHLFSFFPEPNSILQHFNQPSIGQYRRLQLLRYLLSINKIHFENLSFNSHGQIIDFGIDNDLLQQVILSGKPFMTSGCPGHTLEVACNRPYANSTPFQAYMGECRNFPFPPTSDDINLIKVQLLDYSSSFIPPIDKSEIFINEDL
ncbi:MAG: radical SAM protein [Candidatus Helarchaeota archaeon]